MYALLNIITRTHNKSTEAALGPYQHWLLKKKKKWLLIQ